MIQRDHEPGTPHNVRSPRRLRRGVTVRKTIDMAIGTFCLMGGHTLLHADRDFDPMETHLDLRTLHPGASVPDMA
jgi:hypothetical protein